MCSLDPSLWPLPAATDEFTSSTNSRERCHDDDGSDCDAPRKHAQPAPSSPCTDASDTCDAMPHTVHISANGGGMPQLSTAAWTPQLSQNPAATFLKQNPQPIVMNTARNKGKSKRCGPHGTPQIPNRPAVHAGTATASQPEYTQEAPHSASTAESSAPQATVPATENFTLVCSRGANQRARALAASPEIPVDPAVAGTILFKPSTPIGTFIPRSRLMLASALSSRHGVTKV
ncbi:hypothetical protein HPB51_008757 [Rhipicephalus microplus]|uniref:Uncharacterized protein n=1 Tax=Rhipicephalus microplus TaxID=6941 RepID=A0A9J6EG63_RHIMP|nr:hypothetical protein HPB51_008757 [Rhipicephalus microplus]